MAEIVVRHQISTEKAIVFWGKILNYQTCRTVLFKQFQKSFSCINQVKFYLKKYTVCVKVGSFKDETVSAFRGFTLLDLNQGLTLDSPR